MLTWIITGCSSGLGRHLALEALKNGDNVVVTARNLSDIKDITDAYQNTALPLSLDVKNNEQVHSVVKEAEKRFGSIDVLVNNAGHGYRAAVEEADEGDVSELFATNFFGPVALIKAVLPGMRARLSGTIVNISSIAARTTAPGSGYYSATKCALEGLSRGLQKEVSPLGLSVIIVEPGAFRTEFAGRSLQQSQSSIADYANTAGHRRKENDKTHGLQQGDPVKGAQLIIKAVNAEKPPLLLLLGSDAVQVVSDALAADQSQVELWKEDSRTTDY